MEFLRNVIGVVGSAPSAVGSAGAQVSDANDFGEGQRYGRHRHGRTVEGSGYTAVKRSVRALLSRRAELPSAT